MLGTPVQLPPAALGPVAHGRNEDIASVVTVQLAHRGHAAGRDAPGGSSVTNRRPTSCYLPVDRRGRGGVAPAGTVAVGAAVRQDPDGQALYALREAMAGRRTPGSHRHRHGHHRLRHHGHATPSHRRIRRIRRRHLRLPEPRPGLHGRPRTGHQSERRRAQ